MRGRLVIAAVGVVALAAGTLAVVGCGNKKTTPELVADLKAGDDKERLVAARLLPQRSGDTAEVVPALTAALKDKEPDIRRAAAIGLGTLADKAADAVPALQEAEKDRDARVRESVRAALTRIDPQRFPARK